MFQLYSWFRYFKVKDQVLRLGLSTIPILLSFSYAITANAFNFDEVMVFENDGIYHINITAELSVPEEHVRNVLTDYIHVYRLSDSVIESNVLRSSKNNTVQVQSRVLCCTSIFCKEVTRVDEIRELLSGDIQATIIPKQSDFRSGTAVWKITARGNKTLLTYIANIEPDFFIPPLLGTQMVVNNMRKQFKTTFNRIERIASINEEREWNEALAVINLKKIKQDEPCNNEMLLSLQ